MSLALAMGTGGGGCGGGSRELSLSTGVVALLDKVDNGDDRRELSDWIDMDDPKEEFWASSAIRTSTCDVSGFGCGVGVGGLFLDD